MLFSILGAVDALAENAQAEAQYEHELKTYGAAKAKRLKQARFNSRKAENKKKSRKEAVVLSSILSPIPIFWLLLSAAGGGLLRGIFEATLIISFLLFLFYSLARIKCNNPFEGK